MNELLNEIKPLNIPTRIKALRKAKGLTQKELAKQAGVSFSMVSKIESGERNNPSLEILEKIGNVIEETDNKTTISKTPQKTKRCSLLMRNHSFSSYYILIVSHIIQPFLFLAFNDIINPNGYVSSITLNQSQEIKKWKQNL